MTDCTTGHVLGTTAATWAIWTTTSDCTSSTAADSTNDAAWQVWTGTEWNDDSSTDAPIVRVRHNPGPQVSEEARRADEEKRRAAEKRRKAAKERAENLLLDNLNPRQRASYRERKTFRIRAASGAIYEIECRKKWHNIFLIDKGRRIKEFCIYANGDVPIEDNWLAQKLLLEHDEERFREIANETVLGEAA